MRHLAELNVAGASAPERVDLWILSSPFCGQKCGLKPGCVDARQVPDGLPANHDGHRERVLLIVRFWDERRFLVKVYTVGVDMDTPEQEGELRLMEGLPFDRLTERPILPGQVPDGNRSAPQVAKHASGQAGARNL